MTDPRNVAHDKKVLQEKKHHGIDVAAGTEHAPQPGKKSHMAPVETPVDQDSGEEQKDKAESGKAESGSQT